MALTPPWKRLQRPLLIGEIGGNHEGNINRAKHLCNLAIASGVDYVKFQIYTGDDLVSPRESPDRHAHFNQFMLTSDEHLALAEMCRHAGVGYCASVWHREALEWIDDYLDFYKVGSGDLTAWPLIASFVKRGKPIMLSTGLSTLREVVDTVGFIRDLNSYYKTTDSLVLLQCTAMYPIADAAANLKAMDTMRAATGAAVGYSDHTCDSLALLIAAARGARVLEFHFTDTRAGKTFRDHQVSLTPSEVEALKQKLDRITALLGDGVKQPMPCEIESGHVTSFRRAIYSRRPLKAGELIQADDLVALRPNHGVDARLLSSIIGKRVTQDSDALEALYLE